MAFRKFNEQIIFKNLAVIKILNNFGQTDKYELWENMLKMEVKCVYPASLKTHRDDTCHNQKSLCKFLGNFISHPYKYKCFKALKYT